ncbi:hypothetical protein LTR62_008064 [Meristemomyces frigidus]|uniref:ribonuclease Z n=1 Tax=Meristemomyces frigidus TaxID=1508187 RepID=A0AAN7TVB2_9PEZI|nr:hypothetical protein LTR62_008064 [Meristemomyces frigidus]
MVASGGRLWKNLRSNVDYIVNLSCLWQAVVILDPQQSSAKTVVLAITDLLSDHKSSLPPEAPPNKENIAAHWEPTFQTYFHKGTPGERWRKRNILGSRQGDVAGATATITTRTNEIAFATYHKDRLLPPDQARRTQQRRLDYVNHNAMKSWVQILTTPTADTPGTTLFLHFDNKCYLLGSLAEGTQRACIQMGTRLLKVSECFISGRTEWSNTGGLIGMILTLADAAASSSAASNEDAKKRAHARGRKEGCLEDAERMKAIEEDVKKENTAKLNLFSPPGLNYTLATARRFVFRKGMPVDVHEIVAGRGSSEGEVECAPYWADQNVKVWAMSVLPENVAQVSNGAPTANNGTRMTGTVSPRKRSHDEVNEAFEGTQLNGTSSSSLTQSERDELTVKAVVGEMFNSSWRLDTLHETTLSEVKLPASIFIRNNGKTEIYRGPLPGQPPSPGQAEYDPDKIVLVRKPWPGALVESLPPTTPKKDAVSYIIRNHTQRGKFDPKRAKELKLKSGPLWSKLSSGHNVLNDDGETITPSMVLGESKEGGGFAVVDIPTPEYIEGVLARPEWRSKGVMAGVGAMIWICGPGVATDSRLKAFMEGEVGKDLEHIVSSPDLCANHLALDSAAAATVRLAQVSAKTWSVPHHDNELETPMAPLPKNARVARRGMTITLEPQLLVDEKQIVPTLAIADIESATSPAVLAAAAKALKSIKAAQPARKAWLQNLPEGAGEAEIVTLGTGSALPSKYRNVSSTLLRVPGWGSMLFDAGENALGQLKRVFSPEEMKEVLRELRTIFISHMHADHHLGTVSVIRAWYEEAHRCVPHPASSDAERRITFDKNAGLAIVSEPAMLTWLREYSQIEDYGFSRLAPIQISPANPFEGRPSRLGWFIPPATLATAHGPEARAALLKEHEFDVARLGLKDIQAVNVSHCAGARAVSFTWPSDFKVSYSGDCRPSQAFIKIGKNSTVLIHEATFDDELKGDAVAKKHSTTSEALGVAAGMQAKACVLTHFSQRYQKIPVLGGAVMGSDGSEEREVGFGERGTGDGGMEVDATEDVPMNAESADLGIYETSSANTTSAPPSTANLPPSAGVPVSISLASDNTGPRAQLGSATKVAVAFDYMRIRVAEIWEMEHFTPALQKLYEESDEEGDGAAGGEGAEGGKGPGKRKGKVEKRQQKAKGVRNN